MSVGGNQELEKFLEVYNIFNLDIQKKYRTKAAQYYREMIKAASEGRVLEKDRPNPEDGSIVIEEERKITPLRRKMEKQTSLKDTMEAALEKTKDFGKNLKEKVNEISIKDVENKAKNAISQIEHKVESWHVKEKLKKVKDKTEDYYNSLAESAKDVLNKYKNHKFFIDDKLIRGEDELLLDPQEKSKKHFFFKL